jgi:hypothetical protein
MFNLPFPPQTFCLRSSWIRGRYKVIRGALDLGGVAGRNNARSKYGSESFHLLTLVRSQVKLQCLLHSEKAKGGVNKYVQYM